MCLVLDDINVKIDKGEFVFLIGLLGLGKLIFMWLLLVVEMLISGDVWVLKFYVNKFCGCYVLKLC